MAIETDNRGGRRREAVDYFSKLPEGCIAHIVSLTSPQDACRLCLVSSVFRSAAESDTVWDRFLRLEYPSIVSPHSRPCPSKKHLFLSIPILIDQGRKSFSLEKVSWKKCYMISARELVIVWGDTPRYWRWIPLPEARFEKVAELIMVCWFEIHGKIDIQMLSPSTLYTVNLVFKASEEGTFGFEGQLVDASVGLARGETTTRLVYLDSETERGHGRHQIVPRQEGDNDENYPKEREDGWLEIELGEFFFDGRQEGELKFRVFRERGGNWKGGLIVQGIEIRPKRG